MPVPAIVAGAAAVAGRLAAKKVAKEAAMKVANTKAGVKVAKTVAKKVQSQAVKQNKKTVEKVARMQEKTKAEKIAKNSVKTKSANKSNPSNEKINDFRSSTLKKIKSGEYAKDQAKLQEITNKVTQGLSKTKPNVVKVNSAVKSKSTDAAKSGNAKALNAANKKGKK
jgi:hypothetical protein